MIEMKVSGIVLDPQSRSPIVVLRDVPERRALMIWIGPPEANSIMLAIENVPLARPATHDLFVNTLELLGVSLHSVVVNRMEDNTFYAALRVNNKTGKQLEIDSRPSEQETKEFKSFIQTIKPSDFSRRSQSGEIN